MERCSRNKIIIIIMWQHCSRCVVAWLERTFSRPCVFHVLVCVIHALVCVIHVLVCVIHVLVCVIHVLVCVIHVLFNNSKRGRRLTGYSD